MIVHPNSSKISPKGLYVCISIAYNLFLWFHCNSRFLLELFARCCSATILQNTGSVENLMIVHDQKFRKFCLHSRYFLKKNYGTFQSILYGSVNNKYLRVNIVCRIFHTYLTMELFICFVTKVLWNLLWENSDITISFFLLIIILWFCYQPVYNLSLPLLFQGCGYLESIDSW